MPISLIARVRISVSYRRSRLSRRRSRSIVIEIPIVRPRSPSNRSRSPPYRKAHSQLRSVSVEVGRVRESEPLASFQILLGGVWFELGVLLAFLSLVPLLAYHFGAHREGFLPTTFEPRRPHRYLSRPTYASSLHEQRVSSPNSTPKKKKHGEIHRVGVQPT